jgi:hypothetical protein
MRNYAAWTATAKIENEPWASGFLPLNIADKRPIFVNPTEIEHHRQAGAIHRETFFPHERDEGRLDGASEVGRPSHMSLLACLIALV